MAVEAHLRFRVEDWPLKPISGLGFRILNPEPKTVHDPREATITGGRSKHINPKP